MELAATPGTIGNRYLLHQKLGSGGMGAVYRATDRLTGQPVALKRLVTHQPGGSEYDTLALRLALSHEFQTLASLRHPNIISVLDYGFDDFQQPYFTMNLLDTAAPLRQASPQQPFVVKVGYIVQVLQALVYLHRHGIIHRDLKPENILVADDGQVKVLDFGLAVVRENATIDSFAGTVQYMAPEVLEGKPPSRASDLYAVGVMAYELFVGRHPFGGTSIYEILNNILIREPDLASVMTALTNADASSIFAPDEQRTLPLDDAATLMLSNIDLPERPAPPPESSPIPDESTDPALVQVLRRMLNKTQEQRYDDAQQAIDELTSALGLPKPVDSFAIRESFLQAAKFVGRSDEFQQLSGAVNQLRGQGSLWLIGGESGVGKSRLLDELRALAMVQGVLVLRGQAIAEGGQPYQLWREPIRHLLIAVEVSETEASVLKQIVPDVDRLLGHEVPNPAPLEGSDAEQRLLSTMVGLFARYFNAHDGGILVILEDLQWASTSLDVITALQASVQTCPLMIIGSYRDDEVPDLPQRFPDGQMLKLQRLSESAIRELSESMLGETGRKPQVVTLLERETEGNVFFLVEVLRALAEEAGTLDRIGSMTLPANVFTGGVQRIIQRRLDQVPQLYRPLLDLAAVAGRQLDLTVLAQVAGKINLDEWLTTCANAAVLDLYDGNWRFAHDKLREYLLDQLSDRQRSRAHRRIAGAIKSAYADSLEEHAAALAYHWSFTDQDDKTVTYSRLAGEQAVDISAYSDAKTHFERALSLIAFHPAERAHEVKLRVQIGDMDQLLGMYDSAREQLSQALEGARVLDDRLQIAKALLVRTWVSLREGSMDQAASDVAEALPAARESGDGGVLAQALYLSALLHLIKGEYADARQYLDESLPLARESGDQAHVANILNALGAVEEGSGDYDEAARHHREAYQIAERTGHRFLAANAQGNLGRLAYIRGDYAESLVMCEQALGLFRQINNLYGEATMLYFLGFNKTALGDDPLPSLIESIRLSMSIGAVTVTLIALCGVVRLWIKQGKTEPAAEMLGMIFNHPDREADIDIEKEGRPLIEQLQRDMPDFDAAFERGKARNFTTFIVDLIDDHA